MVSWLKELAETVAAPLALKNGEEEDEEPDSIEAFILAAPQPLIEDLREFLGKEGIANSSILHEVLTSSDGDGLPMILERAKQSAKTATYTFLRTACKHMGSLPCQRVASPTAKSAASAPVSDTSNNELPDYKRLRKLLEAAAWGDPLSRALPTKAALDLCDAAASDRGPMPVKEIDAVTGDRPLAIAIMERIRGGWAELLTARTLPADLLNTIYSMAEVAADKRYPQAVAERAAVRYSAGVRHLGYLKSLPMPDEYGAMTTYSAALQSEHPTLADRLLQEENTKPGGNQPGISSRGAHPKVGNGEQHCLLWGVGQCRSGAECKFIHTCPYRGPPCGGTNGGCLIDKSGHLSTFQRQVVKEKIVGKATWTGAPPTGSGYRGQQQQPRGGGRRSRSRSPAHDSGQNRGTAAENRRR
jgi:hypothetical protein